MNEQIIEIISILVTYYLYKNKTFGFLESKLDTNTIECTLKIMDENEITYKTSTKCSFYKTKNRKLVQLRNRPYIWFLDAQRDQRSRVKTT